MSGEAGVKAVAEYVRSLPLPSNMEALVTKVFGSADDKRADGFKQSVQYYLNGTANGFLKYCSSSSGWYILREKELISNIEFLPASTT